MALRESMILNIFIVKKIELPSKTISTTNLNLVNHQQLVMKTYVPEILKCRQPK